MIDYGKMIIQYCLDSGRPRLDLGSTAVRTRFNLGSPAVTPRFNRGCVGEVRLDRNSRRNPKAARICRVQILYFKNQNQQDFCDFKCIQKVGKQYNGKAIFVFSKTYCVYLITQSSIISSYIKHAFIVTI